MTTSLCIVNACACSVIVGTDFRPHPLFWKKIFRKKARKVPRKRRHWVTSLFKHRRTLLLNNGVTQ